LESFPRENENIAAVINVPAMTPASIEFSNTFPLAGVGDETEKKWTSGNERSAPTAAQSQPSSITKGNLKPEAPTKRHGISTIGFKSM